MKELVLEERKSCLAEFILVFSVVSTKKEDPNKTMCDILL